MKNLTFEEALVALEDIVKKLELGTLSLEDSLLAYEEGIKLARLCSQTLESARQRVSILSADANGVITDRPFVQGAEDAD